MSSMYQAPSEQEFIQNAVSNQKGQSELESLAKLQVSTSKNAQNLVNHYGVAMQFFYPNGFDLYNIWRPKQDQIYDATNPPDPKKSIKTIASMFQAMKAFAVANNLTKLADSVTESAYWFWKNIEQPAEPKSSLAKYGTSESDPAVLRAKKRERRSKYIKWGVLGMSIIAGASMLYFAFKPQSKSKARNPRKRTSSGVGKITKGRVRKRNRKAPVLTKRKKNPVIPRTSSLSAYRKKHDAEKRAKANRTNRKKTVRSKSKKGLRLKK
jgi:hypothetical protein